MSIFSALKKASAAVLDEAADRQSRVADLAESRDYKDLEKLDRMRDSSWGIKDLAQELRESAINTSNEDE